MQLLRLLLPRPLLSMKTDAIDGDVADDGDTAKADHDNDDDDDDDGDDAQIRCSSILS